MEQLRVALIGKTGAGKSALGNTLLKRKAFKSTTAAESVTIKCEAQTGTLSDGRSIKVVDTPGIMDTKGRDVRDEVVKAIAALSPGPHAFIIVLQPGRATAEEKRVIKEMKGLFGDETFLEHTIIVMTRRNDIEDEDGNAISIETYMSRYAAPEVVELYNQCGQRIVAVENKASEDEKSRYAQEVANAVTRMGGYYSHAYFKLLQEMKIKAEETAKLRREVEKAAAANNRQFCTIL